MGTISGLAQLNGRSLVSERQNLGPANDRRYSMLIILALSIGLLACGTPHRSTSTSVELSSNQQVLLVTSPRLATPTQLMLEHLPVESTIAPGLHFRPQRFDQIRLSPDERYVAFSTMDHHVLVGLLDLSTTEVREIDVITEGDVVAFHWAGDSEMLVYDFIPPSGYRRVTAYNVQSKERLVLPRNEGRAARHIAFEKWGSQPHEVIVAITDIHTTARRTEAIQLVPRK